MSWRSVVITQPAYLSLEQGSLHLRLEKDQARIPLEDICVLVLDNPQITLSLPLLSACADNKIAVITVGFNHLPNGVYLPFMPHTRAVKMLRAQLALSVPKQKQLQQKIIQQKIKNQAVCLDFCQQHEGAARLYQLSRLVKSGDSGFHEAQAAQLYFPLLFNKGFTRENPNFYNAALNYGYSVLRAAIARSLLAYGLLPALGLFHASEQNIFNLADDVIEPYRPFVDYWVLKQFPDDSEHTELTRAHKAQLVSVLHHDIVLNNHAPEGACTVLASIDAVVMSVARAMTHKSLHLVLPDLQASLEKNVADEDNHEP